MKNYILNFYQPSQLLTNQTLELWLADAKVLEQDRFGVKVAQLADGKIIKIFRVKRWYSSARFFSYARSFCRNAKRLTELNIPTVQVKQLFHCESALRTAVLYEPLLGSTFMQLLKSDALTEAHVSALGEFIAHLHDLGVYFRGLHLGNIVFTPNGRLGLIDISEMTISPFRLSVRRRLRNFERFWRKKEDPLTFGERNIAIFARSFVNSCSKVQMQEDAVKNALMYR